jgi:DsbC/DsbD-like thiol-disulfide interchange protein
MIRQRARIALSATLRTGLCAGLLASPVAAEGLASPWVEGFNNKVRLIAGRTMPQGGLVAGIDIAMSAGWKTYWRTPGEAGGVPPEFDWSASENLSDAKVLYPAPHRLIDKAGATIGYKDRVLFPVALTAKDPALPIVLKLKAAYGVCKELCVPAEAELDITVPPEADVSNDIAAVLPSVPRAKPIQETDPVVSKWRLEVRAGKPVLVIEVSDPSGSIGDAFVDAAGGVYVPLPKKISGSGGNAVYEVDLTDGVDYKDLKGKPLAVTLTGAKGQSETSITLP